MIKTKFVTLVILPFLAFGADLKTQGHIFEIKERDEVEHMQKEVNRVSEAKEAIELLRKSVQCAPKMHDLPRATKKRTYTIDPTFTLDKDLADVRGHVYLKKGTTLNPLDHSPLKSTLVLFNGEDVQQVKWVEKECATDCVWIIASGGYSKLNQTKEFAFGVDYNGSIVDLFRIRALPARVRQVDDKLEVEEIPVKRGIL